MDEFPFELQPRRQEIYDGVVARGRARVRRRVVAAAVAIALVIGTPIVAVAYATSGGSSRARVVATPASEPTTTVSGSTTVASSTIELSTTAPPMTVAVVTTSTPDLVSPTTTALVCRNSTNPACGPFHYDPPPTNAPATLVVGSVEPAHPYAGQTVTFTLYAVDPDTRLLVDCGGGGQDYGDGTPVVACEPSCAAPGYGPVPEFGPWDPPAPEPTDTTVTLTHRYTRAGTIHATFHADGDDCGPRPSTATATVTMTVAAAPPTTFATTTTTAR
jgi:hypothetical protein